jgi:hypothetical protein
LEDERHRIGLLEYNLSTHKTVLSGYACWLRCDDSTLRGVAEQTVTAPAPGSAPYILFYRRGDTLVGMDKAAK